jgi:stress-induced morphogen
MLRKTTPASRTGIFPEAFNALRYFNLDEKRFRLLRLLAHGQHRPKQDFAMAMDAHDIEKLIKDGIPDAKVTIRDLAGDGDHYAAEVVAESFRGKSRVQQHQMVYDALKGNMGGVLHALALQTSVPG